MQARISARMEHMGPNYRQKFSQFNAHVLDSAGTALWFNTASGTRLMLSPAQHQRLLEYQRRPELLTAPDSHPPDREHPKASSTLIDAARLPEPPPPAEKHSQSVHPSTPLRTSDAQLAATLLQHGFFVPEAVDEVQRILHRLHHTRTQTRALGLAISLTSDCNLACPYCVVPTTCGRGAMPEPVQDALLRWWEKQLLGRSHCSFEWMGGEPLLYPDALDRLGTGLLERAERAGVQLSAHSVTTNGTRLSPSTIEMLQRLRVAHLQITLDGPPEVHDRSRPGVNGGGSFADILEGLHRVAGTFSVAIRVNVRDETQAFVLLLLDRLAEEGLQRHVTVYPARVYPPAVKSDCGSSCGTLSQERFATLSTWFTVGLLERGFPLGERPASLTGGYCGAYQRSYFVAGPDGRLYRCPSRIGQEAGVVGSVLLDAPTALEEAQDHYYQVLGPTKEKGCLSCKVLPLCLGGCPEESRVTGKLRDECSPWRFRLQQQLVIEHECDNARRGTEA